MRQWDAEVCSCELSAVYFSFPMLHESHAFDDSSQLSRLRSSQGDHYQPINEVGLSLQSKLEAMDNRLQDLDTWLVTCVVTIIMVYVKASYFLSLQNNALCFTLLR